MWRFTCSRYICLYDAKYVLCSVMRLQCMPYMYVCCYIFVLDILHEKPTNKKPQMQNILVEMMFGECIPFLRGWLKEYAMCYKFETLLQLSDIIKRLNIGNCWKSCIAKQHVMMITLLHHFKGYGRYPRNTALKVID